MAYINDNDVVCTFIGGPLNNTQKMLPSSLPYYEIFKILPCGLRTKCVRYKKEIYCKKHYSYYYDYHLFIYEEESERDKTQKQLINWLRSER
jgi:hypothetical protein